MGAGTEAFNLKTVLSLQTEEFNKGVEAANKQSQKMTKNFKKSNKDISDSFLSMGKSLAAPLIGLASIGTIVSFGNASVEAAEKSEVANKRLLKALNGNVSAFNDLTRYADQLRLKTGVSGSSIKQIEMLAVGAGYGTDKIKKLVSASIELSSITGKDLQASYMMLNKTLSGSAGKLAMIDPAFKSLTKEQLKNGAGIDLIIAKYGGMAEISATSSQKLSSDWSKFQASQGKNLLEVRNGFLDVADSIVRSITPTRDVAREMETERQKVNALTIALKDNSLPLESRRLLLIQLNQIDPEVAKNQSAEKLNYDKLTASLSEYNKQTVNRILLERESAKLTESQNRGADLVTELNAKETQLGGIVDKYLLGDSRLKQDIKDKLTAQYNKDNDLASYAMGLGNAIQSEIKKQNPDYKGGYGISTNLLNQIAILKRAVKANSNLNDVWQNANKAFSKKHGLNVDPIKSTDNPGGDGSGAKAESAKQKLSEVTKDLILGFNKEIAADEFTKKNAEVDLWIEAEKRKVEATKATKAEQKESLDLIDQIAARKRNEIKITALAKGATSIGSTVTDQFGTKTIDNSANTAKNAAQGLSPMAKATKEALEFGKTMTVVKGITNDALGSIGDSMGTFSAMFGEQTAAFKAFATTQAVISTYLAAAQVMANPLMLDPFSKGLAMAATISMGLANVAKINGVKFAEGGIVPGSSYSGDKVHAFVNSGEMILNGKQQANLFSTLNGSGNNNSFPSEIRLIAKGSDLVGVITNHSRTQSKIR
jgi:hypothetical protein